MAKKTELVLYILEIFLKKGRPLSEKELCSYTKYFTDTVKQTLNILEKRGYIKKEKNSDKYILTEKIAMLA